MLLFAELDPHILAGDGEWDEDRAPIRQAGNRFAAVGTGGGSEDEGFSQGLVLSTCKTGTC